MFDPRHRTRGVVSAATTLWYISTTDVAAVLHDEPRADRGFGRKFLAQLRPDWPVTPIGQFPLNRSTDASRGEFYIAAYPGVAVVHTLLDAIERPSRLSPDLLSALPADDIYAISTHPDGFGAFAHWTGGRLQRSFAAHRDAVYEDIGLPEPFEGPFWAGEDDEPLGGINLPFVPAHLARAAQTAWLGVEISPTGPDVNVAAFAVDGRPEPKIDEPRTAGWMTVDELASTATAQLGIGAGNGYYDDYEDRAATPESGADLARVIDDATAALHQARARAAAKLRGARSRAAQRLRHTDR